jgi:hypothetical protein
MLSTTASYMFTHIAQNDIQLFDVRLFFYTNILEKKVCVLCTVASDENKT